MNINLKIIPLLVFCLLPFIGRAQKVFFDDEVIVYKTSYIDPESGSKFWMLWTKYNYDEDPYFVKNIYIISDNYTYDARDFGDNSRRYTLVPNVKKLILHEPAGEEPFLEALLTESATDYYKGTDGHDYESFFVREWGKKLPDDIANEILDLTCGNSKFHTHSVLKYAFYNADLPGVTTKSTIIQSEKKDRTKLNQESKQFYGH